MFDSRVVDVPHIPPHYRIMSVLCLFSALLTSAIIAGSSTFFPIPSVAIRIFFTGLSFTTYGGTMLTMWLLFKRSADSHLVFSGFFISFLGLVLTLITIWQYPPLALPPEHFLYIFFIVTGLQLSFVFFLFKKFKNKKLFILFPISMIIILLILYFFFDQIHFTYFLYLLIGYIIADFCVSLAKPLHLPLVTPRET